MCEKPTEAETLATEDIYVRKDECIRASCYGKTYISMICAVCRGNIPYRGPHTFPICNNCLRILRNIVASDKSNWGHST